MKKANVITCMTAGAFALLSSMAFAQDHSMLSGTDRRFMMEAAKGGTAEVKLGELALERGTRESVRRFGQRMVDDHSKANQDLSNIAGEKGIALPTSMDARSRALYDRLRRLHGSAFDRAYLQAMKADHAKDVREFQHEANYARDRDVRAFAANTLPIIREHYRMVSAMTDSSQTMRMHRSSRYRY